MAIFGNFREKSGNFLTIFGHLIGNFPEGQIHHWPLAICQSRTLVTKFGHFGPDTRENRDVIIPRIKYSIFYKP